MPNYKFVSNGDYWNLPSYEFLNPIFAFCGAPSKSKTIAQKTRFFSCRESFQEVFDGQFIPSSDYTNYGIPLKRTRIIFYVNTTKSDKPYLTKVEKDFDTKMKTSVKVINILEKKHKWTLTKLHKLDQDQKKGIFMNMVVGNNKWIRSPQMLSMFILILRGCSDPTFKNVKNYEGLMTALGAFIRTEKRDSSSIYRSYKYWDKVMENFNNLFNEIPMTDAFNRLKYVNKSVYHEGITYLCEGHCGYGKLKARFTKHCK